jgi:hypothetical protein
MRLQNDFDSIAFWEELPSHRKVYNGARVVLKREFKFGSRLSAENILF